MFAYDLTADDSFEDSSGGPSAILARIEAAVQSIPIADRAAALAGKIGSPDFTSPASLVECLTRTAIWFSAAALCEDTDPTGNFRNKLIDFMVAALKTNGEDYLRRVQQA
jgi:hypothetical protein